MTLRGSIQDTTDFLCVVPAEIVAEYAEWTECAAFRFVKIDAQTVEIQVTNDLDALTRPEPEAAR